jgi:enoyl-CoA hydratase/carnithine racemase
MGDATIECRSDNGIAEVILNRPNKRNALTLEMIEELATVLKTVQASEASAVILRAAGPSFCAGHDYEDMLGRDLSGMRQLMHSCSALVQLIHQLPQPVIAAVQGYAIGAGCQMALSCDMVIAAEDAAFRTPGGARGWFCFTPMVALARAVGRKRALEMLMTGEFVTAEKASSWGMINRVVPAADLEASAIDLALKASQGSRQMMGLGKHAYYAQIDLDEAKAYDYAAELMASTGTMPDAQARMQSFVSGKGRD